MVSNMSITAMVISIVIAIVFPLALCIYFRIRYKISFVALGIGAAIFIVFSQVLERLLHSYMLFGNSATADMLKNPIIFGIYGGLAAGIFEEVGRFVGFKFLLKKSREWKDGIAYGIGHGGIEAILIGVLGNLNNIIYSKMINTGTFENTLGHALPASTINQIKSSLINTSPILFAVSGIERVLAVTLQLGLSLLVLYAIKKRKYIFLLLAIFIHALVDFLAVFLQQKGANIGLIEGIVLIFAIISFAFIIKSKKLFLTEKTHQ